MFLHFRGLYHVKPVETFSNKIDYVLICLVLAIDLVLYGPLY